MRMYVKAAWGGWNKFYGLPDVEYTVPNDTDDPTIYFNGKYYNYYDIEDTLWDFYKEDCEENGVAPDESDFEHFVEDNVDLVYEVLENARPKSSRGRGVRRDGEFYGPANASRRARGRRIMSAAWVAPNGKKYGKQQKSRFPYAYRFTNPELKAMIRDGVAEEITSPEELESLNYDTIGFSWSDLNGHKNGFLVKDTRTGDLYVGIGSGLANYLRW